MRTPPPLAETWSVDANYGFLHMEHPVLGGLNMHF